MSDAYKRLDYEEKHLIANIDDVLDNRYAKNFGHFAIPLNRAQCALGIPRTIGGYSPKYVQIKNITNILEPIFDDACHTVRKFNVEINKLINDKDYISSFGYRQCGQTTMINSRGYVVLYLKLENKVVAEANEFLFFDPNFIVSDENCSCWRHLSAINVKYFGYNTQNIFIGTNELESLEKDILSDDALRSLFKYDSYHVERYLARHNRKLIVG